MFNCGLRGGCYWFSGGWNLRVVVVWVVGLAFGLLVVDM